MMKESELENAPESWQSARYSLEYANYIVQVDLEGYGITMCNGGKGLVTFVHQSTQCTSSQGP